MDDAVENEISAKFANLARYREQLATATDAELRASLSALIREIEDHLGELRRVAYRALTRH